MLLLMFYWFWCDDKQTPLINFYIKDVLKKMSSIPLKIQKDGCSTDFLINIAQLLNHQNIAKQVN